MLRAVLKKHFDKNAQLMAGATVHLAGEYLPGAWRLPDAEQLVGRERR